MNASYETLICNRPTEHVLLLTLNRPQAANAMNTQMGRELVEVFEQFQLDLDDVRCIVMIGAGEKAFCAGADLKERRGMSDEAWQAQHLIYERMARAILHCPIPIIGAVNGAAYGGGCEIALACDFIYAADSARFALPEVTLGILPGAGGTQNLPRAVGLRRAKEVILTGSPFTAQEAAEWGMVNRVVPLADVMPATLQTASRIASNAPIAIRQAKQAMHRGAQMSLWDGLALEIETYNRLVPTADRREGIDAFNEKRKPVFRGC
ncbi:MAG TPA: enoyl-CoA hydratase-related protein [Burkholderiales bacterium]|nr:enoyl-CoA hydratase-related protein [Burkholderiales bacterium]